MSISNLVDKKYEKMTVKEIAVSPVCAIQGISADDAQKLKDAFNVTTVAELANLKYVKWAQKICAAANDECNISIEEMQKEAFKKLKDNKNIEKQFCTLYEEIGEAYEAYRKNKDDLGEELGTCGVYLLQLVQMLGFSLGVEIKQELDIDD